MFLFKARNVLPTEFRRLEEAGSYKRVVFSPEGTVTGFLKQGSCMWSVQSHSQQSEEVDAIRLE